MGNTSNVTVERAIVHLINHQDQKLTESDVELSLSDKLREYFNNQVKNAAEDDQTASATFSSNGDQSAITACYKILADRASFVPGSKELATLLMKAMGTDARIKPQTATLATCIYADEAHPGIKFLALIKLDPFDGFIEKVVPVRGGGRLVTLEGIDNVMPANDAKLRKAALIPPKGTLPNLDLYLLDRQAAGVAIFFGKGFLNTTLALDPVKSVSGFVTAVELTRKTLMKVPDGKPERIGPNESDALIAHVEEALLTGRVNKRKFIEHAPLHPEGKKLLEKRLDAVFHDDTRIKFDRGFARKKYLEKVRYRGDQDFLLEFAAEFEKDVIVNRVEDPQNNQTTLTVVVRNLHRIT